VGVTRPRPPRGGTKACFPRAALTIRCSGNTTVDQYAYIYYTRRLRAGAAGYATTQTHKYTDVYMYV